MTTDAKAEALLALSRLAEQTSELMLRVLGTADDVAEHDAARDPAAWLAHHTRREPGECRRLLRLARDLHARPVAAAALREGAATVQQAEVICRAVEALPPEAGTDVARQAEEALVAHATRFAPRELRHLGHRVLEVVDPEAADEAERRILDQQERHAATTTFLRTRRNTDGTTDLRARVSDAVADRLLTYLRAYSNPRTSAPETRESQRDDQRLGHALGALLEHLDPDRLPLHGGDATTVVVTIPLTDLLEGLGPAVTGDEQRLTASEARRLACTAHVVPAVLGGTSEVLDLGRSRRLFSRAQRRALALKQPTCRAEGCDVPAPWCEAHHAGTQWAGGGRTDLADGVLLCSFHHHRVHDPRHRMARGPGGRVTFPRRT